MCPFRRLPGCTYLVVLLDPAQPRFSFNGFPLPALVLAQLDAPFALAAPLGGSLLVTGLARERFHARALLVTPGRAQLAALASVTAGAPLVAGAAVTTQPAGTLDAAVVQGAARAGYAVLTNPQDTTDRQFAVADQIIGSPDLILLPENVNIPNTIAGSDARVAALAQRLGAPVAVGVVENQGLDTTVPWAGYSRSQVRPGLGRLRWAGAGAAEAGRPNGRHRHTG